MTNYLALYRKYRPKELDEVVGQGEVKKILASSVKNGTITHAYLFSGPRGTGKTTMAKILAKMVNCECPVDGNACNKCNSCLNVLNSNDVIEIDAASNNGVDEIRDLREKANLVPTNSKYKVYIIDEVHMLTTQAFNALLKTLEEPPKHVIFILATTEYYKIPMTITSRCQKFQFTKISDDLIVSRLREISDNENIDISDEALSLIAKISDGGMRDSINFLDQLRSFKSDKIEINDVNDVCGNVSIDDIVSLLINIKNDNYDNTVAFFEEMNISGKNYGKFLEDMINFLKDVLLFKKNVSYKYIKSNINDIEKIVKIYSENELLILIDEINNIFDRLKNVSKQSVVIISNFLLIIEKIKNNTSVNEVLVDKKNDNNKNIDDYDLAFKFTNNEKIDNGKFTDNNDVENVNFDNNNNFEYSLNNDYNKDIIINNAFALANKDIKRDLQIKMTKITDYLTDKKFMNAASSFLDVSVEVAGLGYIIFSAKSPANVEKVYKNYRLCCELIEKLMGDNYNFSVITSNEWSNLRDEYINNIKKGIKYQVKEFENKLFNDDMINKENTIVDKLFELVGEENIEFK